MLHQVLRKFKAEGVVHKPGAIVETSSWKNERLLVEHRFLGKPSVPQKDAATVVAGANVVEASAADTGANSTPEPPKATPTKPAPVEEAVKAAPAAVKSTQSGKPAVLRKRALAVGKVPVAGKAKKVKING